MTDPATKASPPAQAPWILPGAPLLLAAIVLIAAPHLQPRAAGYVFLLIAVLLAASLGLVGWLVNGRPIGAFIDNRNRLSLSKLQAGAWTVIVIAAFATAAAYNAAATTDHQSVSALNIIIPGELLLAMGISATSLVAAPALLSLKSKETATAQTVDALPPGSKANGKVVTHDDASEASWSNLVTGDEVGNAQSPDLGKIQQVLITLVLLGCYAAYVATSFNESHGVIARLPVIDKSFVWLLGLSHASYLAYKAAPHTATGDQ